MSHIVKVTTQIRDAAAVAAACRRLGLAEPVVETVKLFTSQATGLAVRLSGWRYPVVCDLASGQLQYDDYGGRWGEKARLDAVLQMYAIEKARIEARKRGAQRHRAATGRRQRQADHPGRWTCRMTTQTIEGIVSPTGETSVLTKGFAGSSCQDASKFLEGALGQRSSEQLNGEFYAEQPAQQRAQEKS